MLVTLEPFYSELCCTKEASGGLGQEESVAEVYANILSTSDKELHDNS
jgi:hypothetical protein